MLNFSSQSFSDSSLGGGYREARQSRWLTSDDWRLIFGSARRAIANFSKPSWTTSKRCSGSIFGLNCCFRFLPSLPTAPFLLIVRLPYALVVAAIGGVLEFHSFCRPIAHTHYIGQPLILDGISALDRTHRVLAYLAEFRIM